MERDMLAAEQVDIIKRITDHPWPGCRIHGFTLMSNAIAAMILVAIILVAVILPLARRYRHVPTGGRNAIELILLFVRDMVARPALHDNAYRFLPFLATLFVFVLGMNLIGILPLESISEMVAAAFPAARGRAIGGAPTGILAVTGGLAGVTLLMVLMMGWRTAAAHFHHQYKWPMLLSGLLSPLLWIWSLSPKIPGTVGVILKLPLTVIELAGVLGRCFALMIRLFANMISGHTLVAVFLLLIFQAAQASFGHLAYVGPLGVIASVAVGLLDLLVAVVQAYVFVILTAIFIGLAMEESH